VNIRFPQTLKSVSNSEVCVPIKLYLRARLQAGRDTWAGLFCPFWDTLHGLGFALTRGVPVSREVALRTVVPGQVAGQ
jgi:hypothetical protein